MRKLLTGVGNLLCPPYCVICENLLPLGQWEADCCCACAADLPFRTGETCEICGGDAPGGGVCFDCQQKKPIFHQAIAAFSYETMAKSIERFKFQGVGHDGQPLGRLMGKYLSEQYPHWINEVDLMTEVPLHTKKIGERGYNQSSLLCKSLAEATGIAYVAGLLERIKYTAPQSTLTAQERKVNLHGVFRSKDCVGKIILLVDDIFTTGSTATECSRALYRAGAKEVRVFCLSKTQLKNH